MRFLTIFLAMFASPAFADDFDDYDPAILAGCINEQARVRDQAQCIGIGADACLTTDNGSFTLGMFYCFDAEWNDWDARLNQVYGRLLTEQALLRDDLLGYNRNLSDPLEQMRIMQRAWIVYRDTACEWGRLQWAGGTGGGAATAECMMRLTAQQAIFLAQQS